jgi:hypothetical protein
MNLGMYRAALLVTIPARRPSGRVEWVPAPAYEDANFRELVTGPAECGPLVSTHGAIIARRLLAEDIDGFRVSARGETSRFLCAMGEWHRRDRGKFEQVYVWAATWDDVPAACIARLRPADGFERAPEHNARSRGTDARLVG